MGDVTFTIHSNKQQLQIIRRLSATEKLYGEVQDEVVFLLCTKLYCYYLASLVSLTCTFGNSIQQLFQLAMVREDTNQGVKNRLGILFS